MFLGYYPEGSTSEFDVLLLLLSFPKLRASTPRFWAPLLGLETGAGICYSKVFCSSLDPPAAASLIGLVNIVLFSSILPAAA